MFSNFDIYRYIDNIERSHLLALLRHYNKQTVTHSPKVLVGAFNKKQALGGAF